MDNKLQEFLQHLDEKGKKQTYFDVLDWRREHILSALQIKPASAKVIDNLVRGIWSGYVSKDKGVYRFLNEYANYCKKDYPQFYAAFHEHIRKTFEGEAHKAMRVLKDSIVYIPKDTIIAPSFLNGMTNDEFVETFRKLQELIYDIYDEIENGSPFEWGWSDWKSITWEGLNHNRVVMTLEALAGSGHINGNVLTVDKNCFSKYAVCKPATSTKLLLNKFITKGFIISGNDNNSSSEFTVSYPNIPNLMPVLYSYFINRLAEDKNHVRYFSYRFIENSEAQSREPLFLALTDGEPVHLRETYYWLYDEAVKHGFSPVGCENMGCYVYRKGKKEWLLLGRGSSYHEDEFLHSPNYEIAAKVRYHHVFQTHPNEINELKKRFPDSFGRPWTQCFKCKVNPNDCKNRVTFDKDGSDYHHCGTKHHLYFHDPDINDVKAILELYIKENNIEEAYKK